MQRAERLLVAPLSLVVVWCLFAADSSIRRFGAIRHIDEIGHLGSDYRTETSADLVVARANRVDDDFEISGRDDAGHAWHAWIEVGGGIGETNVWMGDFDHNSRQDLMVASSFPRNGRCLYEETVSFLMIDALGRPVPWIIDTQIPEDLGVDRIMEKPPLVVQTSGNSRALFVATDCEYGDPSLLGEDRSITGVYEAKDAKWRLLLSPAPSTWAGIIQLVRQSYKLRPDRDRLKHLDVSAWPDLGNDPQIKAPPGTRLANVSNTLRLSDGETCYGWPTVILDRPDGREIVASSSNKLPAILHEIVDQGLPVSFSGQTSPGRCSPAYLWAVSSAR